MRDGDWIKLWITVFVSFVLVTGIVAVESYGEVKKYTEKGYVQKARTMTSGYIWVKDNSEEK